MGAQWRLEEVTDSGSTWDITLAARFFTGHCHLGDFQLPWHEHEDAVHCPFCDEPFTRAHLVWECCGVHAERDEYLGGMLPRDVSWSILLGRGAMRLGRFLRIVGLMVDRAS